VPVPELYTRLRRFITETRQKKVASDRVFLGQRRRPGGEVEPLTESGVQQIVRELAEKAEIGRRVHPHLFRHSFITWQLRRGTTPMHLKVMVGHKSLAMIDKVYSHLEPTDAYDAMLRSLQATGK
jgi:integrase/recombinase XerD